MDDNKLTLINDDGTETVCDILFTHEHDGKKYVVFEIPETDEITAAVYVPDSEDDDSEGAFLDIETDEEWEMLEKLLEQYFDELEAEEDEE